MSMSAAFMLRQSVTSTAVRSSIASSSRLFSNTAIRRRGTNKVEAVTLKSPSEFLSTIAKPNRGDLSSISNLLGEDASWDTMFGLNRYKLKKAGVPIKERKYFFWAKEKFRQGEAPETIAIDVNPKKKVRGWGPRVQKGIRVRGRRRAGEK